MYGLFHYIFFYVFILFIFLSIFCRDILCIDKTGTLTMNHAIFVNHVDCWGLPQEKVLRYAFLNSYFKTDQKYPLDDAILAHVYSNGFKFQPSKWRKIDEIPFDFIRRRVSVVLETEDRHLQFFGRFVVTKGALLEVMRVCSFIEHFHKDEISTFSLDDYQRILNLSETLSNEGLRVMAVAIKKLEMVRLTSLPHLFSFFPLLIFCFFSCQ